MISAGSVYIFGARDRELPHAFGVVISQGQRPLPCNRHRHSISMIQTGLIPNAHNDLVTDASYDFYGLRLATCSLDQRSDSLRLSYRLVSHLLQNKALATGRDQR
jgi:hypothetical protein